jgi:thiol-disulfide isomerase/thioredoxin
MSKHCWSLILLVTLAASAVANRQGDQLIRQIKAVKPPKWVEAKAVNASYEASWGREYEAYLKKRNALILKLFLVDPKNPQTADLMYARWIEVEDNGTNYSAWFNRLSVEIGHLKSQHAPPSILEAGLAAKAQNALSLIFLDPSMEAEAVREVRQFSQGYPNSKYLRDVMLMACWGVSEAPRPLAIARYLEKFPDDEYAKRFVHTSRQAASIGKPVELKFTDAISGQKWDMTANRGKVVLIDFWATWCGPCREKLPELMDLYQKYHVKGLEIIGVSLDDPEAKGGLKKLKDFVEKKKMPWPQYHQGHGWESTFSSGWGIMGIPTTFLIDKQGNLRVVNEKNLRERIESLLAESLPLR